MANLILTAYLLLFLLYSNIVSSWGKEKKLISIYKKPIAMNGIPIRIPLDWAPSYTWVFMIDP